MSQTTESLAHPAPPAPTPAYPGTTVTFTPGVNAATGHPHGYSGATKQVTLVTLCLYTHPDQQREQFPMGTYEAPVEVANSDYFRYHTNEPPPPAPNPGTPEHAEMLRQQTMAMVAKNRLAAEQNAMNAAGVNRANLEVQVRAEMAVRLREELRAELAPIIRAEVAESVRAEVEEKVRAELADEVKAGRGKKA